MSNTEKSANYSTKNNPMEFAYAVTTQTLTFENHFSHATFDNGSYPLAIYDGFSRLTGALISSDKKVATFNIPKRDIPMLLKRSDFALSKAMEYDLEHTSSDTAVELSPAYTVKIRSGKLKGKTPAEVLIENPDNKALLNQHYEFVQNNMKDPNNRKYEKTNREQIEAILDAAKLLESGGLSSEHVTKGITIPIYTPGFRPLVRKKRDDGKSFVYEVKVYAHLGADLPIEFTVENYYAPVVQLDDGRLNVKPSEKDTSSAVTNTTSISYEMWEDIVYNIRMQMRAFENNSYTTAYKMAEAQEKENRNSASVTG